MNALRTDLISLFDIDFKGNSLSASDMNKLERSAVTGHPDEDLYLESFGWVYYGDVLPGCRRYFFNPPTSEHITGIRCCTLLVRPENGAGVFSIWQTFGSDVDPLQIRQENLYNIAIPWLRRAIGIDIKYPDRVYPFIALRVDTDDLEKYTEDNAEELGKIFTGYFEEDEREYLIEIMRKNLSKRRYERLFLRWTDVLAAYSRSISVDQQEKSMLRAAQIYETCILVSRLCQNLSEEANAVSSWLRYIPLRPLAVGRILSSFMKIELQFVVAPPVQSVEAGRMLSGAYKSFGIDNMIRGTRSSCKFLENRFQWSKTQFIVLLGVITYLLDKLEIFTWIARNIFQIKPN